MTKAIAKTDGWDLARMADADAHEAAPIKARVHQRPRRPKVVITSEDEGMPTLVVGGGDESNCTLHSMKVFDALGTRSTAFVDDALVRLRMATRLFGDDRLDSMRMTAALALVAAIEPSNELEATMAIQMVAANEAALQSFAQAQSSQFMEQAVQYSNMGNKAMRSFALHAEAIAKMRRGGEQIVKHVHVDNRGGQAVVADTVIAGGQR